MKILLALILTVSFAQAATVKTGETKFQVVSIEAEKVKGIKVILKKSYGRTDCNRSYLEAESVFVRGNREFDTLKPINWNSRFIVETSFSMTVMGCRSHEPIPEVATVELDYPAFSNENIDGEVKIDVLIPEGLAFQVVEY